MDGVIIVDKPEGWTSHDVVNRVRRIAQTRRVGHLGTLDPIATGVLPLVVGRATRLAQFYAHSDKVYEGVIRFGWSTDTYDRTGKAAGEEVQAVLDAAELDRILDRFRGQFLQMPPPVSAKKIGGRRAYELVRQSVVPPLVAATVEIFELSLLEVSGPEASLRVHCSGGTYVRSLAHDLGQALGCGAHLQQLRRTASGEFGIAQAHTLARLEELAAGGRLEEALIPMLDLLPGMPNVYVDELTAAQIRHGRNFPASPFLPQPAARHVKAIARPGELIAIGEAVLPNVYHPIVVV